MTVYTDLKKCRKKYNIIYADVPWDYRHKGNNSAATDHYNVPGIAQILDLPVKKISSENCILFLWCTWPFYKEALDVMEAWGFEYKTCAFVWKKTYLNGRDKTGMGFWTRPIQNTYYLAQLQKTNFVEKVQMCLNYTVPFLNVILKNQIRSELAYCN
ncbi:MAG: methyltransferase [Cenarchaeum symbiont of Oopsacas minuta]|nr:methyltransferase [Cenarchaeum symbiont of Oopsacas minuta]